MSRVYKFLRKVEALPNASAGAPRGPNESRMSVTNRRGTSYRLQLKLGVTKLRVVFWGKERNILDKRGKAKNNAIGIGTSWNPSIQHSRNFNMRKSCFLFLSDLLLLITLMALSCPFTSSFVLPASHSAVKTETSTQRNVKINGDSTKRIPFIVEELGCATKEESQEISNLVVNVFFQEEAEKLESERSQGPNTPWKTMQLAYLRNMQYGDVKGRKFVLPNTISNTMFVAREIMVASEEEDILEGGLMQSVLNKQYLGDSAFYKRGQVLGFVDVTEKNFGIATGEKGEEEDGRVIGFGEETELENGSNTPLRTKSNTKRPLRPVLTNLSVKEEARGSGVGSKLVEACEEVVMSSWPTKYYEMVLEVEQSNVAAQKFYEKRGYKAIFADPTSRRFDTSSFFLKKVRTTKICYKKDLTLQRAKSAVNKEGSALEKLLSYLPW